jgi:hypothetical protein
LVLDRLGATIWVDIAIGTSAKLSFACTGRADSIVGQSAKSAPDSDEPFGVDSCEGQCGFADSECAAGPRHVASHHARAGAAAPMSNAITTIGSRFNEFSIPRPSVAESRGSGRQREDR